MAQRRPGSGAELAGEGLDEPTEVAGLGFDEARSCCPGFEALPATRNISERIGLPWSKVLELAELPPEGRTIGLGRLIGEREQQDWLTPAGVEFALRLVATRLGVPNVDAQRLRRRPRPAASREPASLAPRRAATAAELESGHPAHGHVGEGSRVHTARRPPGERRQPSSHARSTHRRGHCLLLRAPQCRARSKAAPCVARANGISVQRREIGKP